jgi:hypothetical protein
MAKNGGGIMLPTSKRGGLLKVVLVALFIGALTLVIKHPVDAAGLVKDGVGGISAASDRVATFIASLH